MRLVSLAGGYLYERKSLIISLIPIYDRINGGVRCFFLYIYWVFALQVFDKSHLYDTNIPRVRSIIGHGDDLDTGLKDGGELLSGSTRMD